MSDSHPEACLRLIDFYFETRDDDFHDDRARQAAAAAKFALGGYVDALDEYQQILEGVEPEQGLYVGSPLEFAFLAARHRSEKHFGLAIDVLAAMTPPGPEQCDERFRYFSASALLSHETGRDPARSQSEARQAMEMPSEIREQYADLVWRLRGILRE